MKRLMAILDDGVLRWLVTIVTFCVLLGAFARSWNEGLNWSTYARILVIWLIVIGYLAMASRLHRSVAETPSEYRGGRADD